MTTLLFNRQFMAQLCIMLAVAIGGWMIFVQPKLERIAELRTTIDANSPDSMISDAGVQQLSERAASLRRDIEAIQRGSLLAKDSMHIYDRLMDIAGDHNVTVHRLNPGQLETIPRSPIAVRRVEITAEGEYIAIANMLDTIMQLPGYVSMHSLQFSPRDEGDRRLVDLRVICDILSPTLPQQLVQLQGALDVQP